MPEYARQAYRVNQLSSALPEQQVLSVRNGNWRELRRTARIKKGGIHMIPTHLPTELFAENAGLTLTPAAGEGGQNGRAGVG
jgi:hypothetical protein